MSQSEMRIPNKLVEVKPQFKRTVFFYNLEVLFFSLTCSPFHLQGLTKLFGKN